LFGGLVQKVLDKSRKPQTRRSLLSALLLDEIFFLLISPWFLIVPAYVIARRLPLAYPPAARWVVGTVATVAGLAYSLWAVRSQWRFGGGTPSLNAPTRHLVMAGPYRWCRNPIQLGSSTYILGLGTLVFSLTTGLIAGVTALLVGIVYIKLVEEKELCIRFGEEYEAYRRDTPLLIPCGRLFRKSARETHTITRS
jgi:protein-S-isoprenylcysteine O-methyltransferase Ste14